MKYKIEPLIILCFLLIFMGTACFKKELYIKESLVDTCKEYRVRRDSMNSDCNIRHHLLGGSLDHFRSHLDLTLSNRVEYKECDQVFTESEVEELVDKILNSQQYIDLQLDIQQIWDPNFIVSSFIAIESFHKRADKYSYEIIILFDSQMNSFILENVSTDTVQLHGSIKNVSQIRSKLQSEEWVSTLDSPLHSEFGLGSVVVLTESFKREFQMALITNPYFGERNFSFKPWNIIYKAQSELKGARRIKGVRPAQDN